VLGDRSLLVVDLKVNPYMNLVIVSSRLDKRKAGHWNNLEFGQSIDQRRVLKTLNYIQHVGFIDEGSEIDYQVLLSLMVRRVWRTEASCTEEESAIVEAWRRR